MPQLNNRSESAVEFKHQNISAILVVLGFPYIAGYKPAFNYQNLLQDVVEVMLIEKYHDLAAASDSFINSIPAEPAAIDWQSVIDAPPRRDTVAPVPHQNTFTPRQYNFAEREHANRRLGEGGESFVLAYERQRLLHAGRSDLANEVEWTSKDKGDGAGFDIRSFNPERDTELFIEVKTTNSGKYQPFYISENELAFASQHPDHYALYRVFQFKTAPKLFALYGDLVTHVYLSPSTYRATF